MRAADANRLGCALSLRPPRLDRRSGAPQHWQASAIQRLHVVTPSEPLPSLRARPFLAGLLATRPAFLGVTLCACLIGLAVAHGSGVPVDAGTLIAVQEEAGWRVGTLDDLGENFRPDQQFLVDELLIHAPQSQLKRIAILDDDASLASSLAEWFNEAGFAATAFTAGQQLLTAGVGQFDGFVVDYVLAGESSQSVIDAIRQRLPEAPVLLLTGKLRDATVSEAELMAVLRSSRVTFFEKPVRPGVLAAALLNHFDQLARPAA